MSAFDRRATSPHRRLLKLTSASLPERSGTAGAARAVDPEEAGTNELRVNGQNQKLQRSGGFCGGRIGMGRIWRCAGAAGSPMRAISSLRRPHVDDVSSFNTHTHACARLTLPPPRANDSGRWHNAMPNASSTLGWRTREDSRA